MVLGTKSSRIQYVLVIFAVALGFGVFGPSFPQDSNYHRFAGVSAWPTTLTNLPFVLVGAWGFTRAKSAAAFSAAAGVFLTGFGSAYYHWSPSDARLVWDRMPMTFVFMSVLAGALGIWIGPLWERRSLGPLLVAGVASVLWWHRSGDLRWYGIVQFGPALVLVPAGITEPRVRGLWRAGAAYVSAKLAESFDRPIYQAIGFSGHSMKHLLGALAAYWVLQWSSTFCVTESPSSRRPPAATSTDL